MKGVKWLPEEPKIIHKLNQNLRRNTCNNYRKLHGLAMRRWVQLRKFDPECESVRRYFHDR